MRWNSAGNSTDKQPQNKDSLTKEYKTEIGKTHERYDKRKPVSIFPIDEIMAPSQFKLRGSYTPRKTKDRNSDGIVTASPQKLWQNAYLTLYFSFNLNADKPTDDKAVRTVLRMDNGNSLILVENNPIFY